MTEIKVGENFRHIDDEDMAALLDILTDDEHSAAPAPPPVIEKAAEWFIGLMVDVAYDLLLKDWIEERRKAIIDHFRKKADRGTEELEEESLPKGIKIYGANGDVLAVVPFQDDDLGNEPRIIVP